MKNKIILGCLAAATCEILFGLSFIFTKSITAQVSDLALISWRFVTAFLFINLYFLISRRRITINGRNLKPLTRIAILNPIIYFICETIGIRMTTASESGAFLACIPVVALIMSSLILRMAQPLAGGRCHHHPRRYHHGCLCCWRFYPLLPGGLLDSRSSSCLLRPVLR